MQKRFQPGPLGELGQREPSLKAEQFVLMPVGAKVNVNLGELFSAAPMICQINMSHEWEQPVRRITQQNDLRFRVVQPSLAERERQIWAVAAVDEDDRQWMVHRQPAHTNIKSYRTPKRGGLSESPTAMASHPLAAPMK
jgi:hypothetical protein